MSDARVDALLTALEHMAGGDLDRRVAVSPTHDEIDAIAHGVNVLVGELQFTTAGLKRATLEAEAANRAKTTFLRNISHEIRTPLSAILALGERLAADGVTDERRADLVARLLSNGGVLLALVDDLLDLSKVEAGRLRFELEPTAPLGIAVEAAAALEIEAERKGVTLAVESAGTPPPSIATDPRRLRQILTNLIGNAIKFTERGSVTVRVAASDDGTRLVIDVSDSGIGLTTAQAEALFAPFQQGDASIAQRFGGSGLGLALSRRLAEGLGGTVELLRSAPGRGSTFRVVLPAPPATLPPPAEAPPASGRALAGLTLLLADDNRDIREPIRELLEFYGATVVEADDGRTAVERARAGNFDLLLMDVRMPELDGLEATRQLRRAGVRTPIVALTADAVEQHREECLAAGCDGHLPKPVELVRLLEVVRALVGRA